MKFIGRIIALLAIWAATGAGAMAQTVPQAAVRQAVAIVVARGINASDSAPVESQGTGFFINSMGLLVTSYHLRENLGANAHPASIAYEVHFDAFAPAVPATNVYSSQEADILILYVPVSGRNVGVLKPAFPNTAKIELAKTPIYAASFAAGSDFSMTPGVITAWSGPIRPVVVPAWTTNVSFAEGQSGSPVVLDDGRVVAVVKGAEASGASMGVVVPVLFIPTQYWDSQSTIVQALASLAPGAETARITVSKTVVGSEPRQIVRTLVLKRDACDPQQQQKVHVTATAGSTIDPTSIQLTTRSFIGKELRLSAISNVTENAFDVTADIIPAGVCFRFIGGVGGGVEARYEAEIRYLERPTNPQSREVIIAEAAAVPGVELPIGTSSQGLNYSITSPRGGKAPFLPRSNELKTINGQKILDLSKVMSVPRL